MTETAPWPPRFEPRPRLVALRLFDLFAVLELHRDHGRLRISLRLGRSSPGAVR